MNIIESAINEPVLAAISVAMLVYIFRAIFRIRKLNSKLNKGPSNGKRNKI